MSDAHHDEGSQVGLTLREAVPRLRSDLKENGREHKEPDRKTDAKFDRLMYLLIGGFGGVTLLLGKMAFWPAS